ncbi:hypothetical protein PPERSA_06716 [Pseudocohnilembus persalinus]|uniref:Uncharacterized protein n=1 Tax=Pseudocohnilembus persalinus TaxID=266149 RepID=A0A0V0QSU8_PSEPJ|nr:hypothetical protein PPERSA_06716 [Pseudocohnilembus persalinus]|eukprot:KRX05082.1 hypothetical protein PPERSA_06716 [Pseudocohnilembus persalinus]
MTEMNQLEQNQKITDNDDQSDSQSQHRCQANCDIANYKRKQDPEEYLQYINPLKKVQLQYINEGSEKYSKETAIKILENYKYLMEQGTNLGDLNEEQEQSITLMEIYKRKTIQPVIREEFFPNNQSQSLMTPLIFTKKPNSFSRNARQMNPQLMAFENYLHLVTQMYFKQSFNISEFIMSPEQQKEQKKGSKKEDIVPEIKKKGRQNRKKEEQLLLKQILADSEDQTQQNEESATNLSELENTNNNTNNSNKQQQQNQIKSNFEQPMNINNKNNTLKTTSNLEDVQNNNNNDLSQSQDDNEDNDNQDLFEDVKSIQYTNILDSLLSPIRYENVYESN